MQHKLLSAGAVLLCLVLSSCTELLDLLNTPASQRTEFTGPRVAVGNGYAWTYVTLDAHEEPLTIGVRLDESALKNLPTGSPHGDEFYLPLPEDFPVAPYDHVTLDWNAKGHEPPGVYDLPHFDIHFYFMSVAERDQIGPMDTAAFNKPLLPEYLAPDYLETPGGVPRMGAHIIDLQSPEIAGSGTFTHTFIYGKYDGIVNFLEPMATQAFLESNPTVSQTIRQPEKWQRAGYYPRQYVIEYDASAETYSIELSDLRWWEE